MTNGSVINISKLIPISLLFQFLLQLCHRDQHRSRLLVAFCFVLYFYCTRESRPLLLAANTGWSRSVLLLAFDICVGLHQLYYS